MSETVDAKGMTKLYQDFYKEAHAKYGDKIVVLMMVGKFYELYDIADIDTNKTTTNIREAAALLEISVRETQISPTQIRLFAGIPEQVLKKYERILVRSGYRGIIIQQTKDGKHYKRELAHIVSAGTYIEAEGEDEIIAADRWLWCFLCDACDSDIYLHSAAINCATGQIILGLDVSVSNRVDSLQNDELYLALSSYEPAEILLWLSEEAAEKGIKADQLLEAFHIRSDIQTTTRKIVSKNKTTVRQEEDLLVRCFSMDKTLLLESLGLERRPEARRCLAYLLSFIEEHNPELIANLKLPTEFKSGSHVRLGNHTLEQLGMINKARDRQNECYYHYFNGCRTACGRRGMRVRLLQPIQDIRQLRRRLDVIGQWRTHLKGKETEQGELMNIKTNLHTIYDIEKLYRKIQLKSANFNDIHKFIISLSSLKSTIESVLKLGISKSVGEESESILKAINLLLSRWSLEKMDYIRSCEAKELNGFGSGIHPWNSDFFPEEDKQEEKWKSYKKTWTSLSDSYRKIVSDAFTEPFIYEDYPFGFKATKARCAKIVEALKPQRMGILAEEIRSNWFLCGGPIDDLNKSALHSQRTWKKLYAEDWCSELAYLLEIMNPTIMNSCVSMLTDIDVSFTLAAKAEEYGYCQPTFVEGDKSGLRAIGLRHGILEQIRKDVPYIPHNVAFGSLADDSLGSCSTANGVLLFGVNSSGKSSLMKSIGLSVLLAQCGCPVPASEFAVCPYGSMFTRILGNDNIWAGMSSFVVEMTEFRSILEYADCRSLVLGDELCAGTETASAAALVAAGLQCLLEKDTTFFFATHLHELQQFGELRGLPNLKWLHLRVRYDIPTGSLIYDRDLLEGAGSLMYGLEVCRYLRMPSDFLVRAEQFRRRLHGYSEEGSLGASSSRYNSSVIRRDCAVCGKADMKELECHHIVYQEDAAADGSIGGGRHKNDASNLVILCEDCHTNHHKGLLEINGWIETSSGRRLDFKQLEQAQQKQPPPRLRQLRKQLKQTD